MERRIEYFSESRIELNRRIQDHPKLVELLQAHPVEEFEIRLSEVAAYCGIVLDGDYLQSDLDGLCDVLIQKLEMMKVAPSIITLN